MTTISEAVDQMKTTAMKLAEVRKDLVTANDALRAAKEAEEDARKKYAVALGELEKLTGGYT